VRYPDKFTSFNAANRDITKEKEAIESVFNNNLLEEEDRHIISSHSDHSLDDAREDINKEMESKAWKGIGVKDIQSDHRQKYKDYIKETIQKVIDENKEVCIYYTNWKGFRKWRTIKPIKIWEGSTEYHKEKQL